MNGHSELGVERVSKDDSGTYSCVAENSVGSIKSLGFVYVKGATSLPVYVKGVTSLPAMVYEDVRQVIEPT